MSRFVLGFLVGALAMYWYAGHGGAVLQDAVGWLEHTAAGYASPSEGAGP